MTTRNRVVEILATRALRETARVSQASGVIPPDTVWAVAKQMITQDPARVSWRVWGSIWSGITALLVIPEVQSAIHAVMGQLVPTAYLPFVTAILGALWPLISKWRDPRPTRGATE